MNHFVRDAVCGGKGLSPCVRKRLGSMYEVDNLYSKYVKNYNYNSPS